MDKTNIFQAINSIISEIEAIPKDKKNTMQGYSFRGIDDIYLAIHDLLAKYGVVSVPTVVNERSEERTSSKGSVLIYRVLTIKYTFYALDGSSIEAVVIGEGMDSGDKASNKAMAVAHKYALLQIFAIPTSEAKDPEYDSHEIINLVVDKQKELIKLIGDDIEKAQTIKQELGINKTVTEMTETELDKMIKKAKENK